ncbi:MAG: hypothetical protein H9W80_06245 [Enterococcus sp.]|nr:hypothetical protein [Enterococcus sp.]
MNYEKKEDKVVEKIAKTIEKLDTELAKIDSLNEDNDKKHRLKKWFEEKKAIHEIKHLLHEIGKYEKYDEKEMKKIEEEFNMM